jgi:hypothetical protein
MRRKEAKQHTRHVTAAQSDETHFFFFEEKKAGKG